MVLYNSPFAVAALVLGISVGAFAMRRWYRSLVLTAERLRLHGHGDRAAILLREARTTVLGGLGIIALCAVIFVAMMYDSGLW